MASVSGSFTSVSVSAVLSPDYTGDDEIDLYYTLSGTYSATVVVERAVNPSGLSWEPMTGALRTGASGYIRGHKNDRFRARCTARVSGTAVYSLLETYTPHVGSPGSSGSGGSGVPAFPPTYVDRSGTVTLGGTAQELLAANPSRKGGFMQNLSNADLYVSEVGTAAATGASILVPAGGVLEWSYGLAPTGAVSIYGATTAQAFAAREF